MGWKPSTTITKTDFKQRAAAARREAGRKHNYRVCRDGDCKRVACEAFKEGREDGYSDGYDDGFDAGVSSAGGGRR